MADLPFGSPRLATEDDAAIVAQLLDAFNREFEAATPGVEVLTARLHRLLRREDVVAILTGQPSVAVALVTLRPNVWYEGHAAILEELYVVPEQRGRGLGSDLLAAVEVEARRRGGEVVEIHVDGEDTDARRFYERYGYSNVDPGQVEPMLFYYRELPR
jgi:ribosomal protein S18 acetylase RimI-like enzyme